MTQAGTESNPLTGRYTPAPVSGYTRRKTREVKVGAVGIGGDNPIRIQSMTISDTMDTAATVKESIALFEAGSEIVRITAPSWKDAENLGVIKAEFKKAGLDIPICADIHFSPKAAMFAVEHVEKVRINPGNFVDQKKFKVREYTDTEYTAELERLHEAFTPLVLRAKELGRALRIGTNHGSLSDRIMNRYGDTPAGMVASAIEFIQIAEDHSFHDIVISMKASNVQVMVQAYRMLVERMDALGMDYPLHLGVTEAGDGQDGRIKSAAGIGSLLDDGLGDTIRVSLTEDPIHELPVARALANRFDKARDRIASSLWLPKGGPALTLDGDFQSTIDPYAYSRREASPCFEGPWLAQTAGPVGLGLPVDFAELSANNSAATLLAGAVREGADLLLLRNANIQAASDWAAANRPALAGAKLILEQSDIIRPQATTLAAFDGVSLTLAADREPASEELDLIQAWQGAGKTVFVHLTPVTASIDLDGMRKVLAAPCPFPGRPRLRRRSHRRPHPPLPHAHRSIGRSRPRKLRHARAHLPARYFRRPGRRRVRRRLRSGRSAGGRHRRFDPVRLQHARGPG